MDLLHKIYQIMTKDSYVPFIIASLAGLRICHIPLYGDFQRLFFQMLFFFQRVFFPSFDFCYVPATGEYTKDWKEENPS